MKGTIWAALGLATAVGGLALGIFFGSMVLDDKPLREASSDSPTMIAHSVLGDVGPQTIKVHGDWTIEIRNPDDSLADRRVFTNDLTADGAHALAGILAGNYTVNHWSIGASSLICLDPISGLETLCGIAEDDDPTIPDTWTQFVRGLTVNGPNDFNDPAVLELSGSFFVQNDGQIDRVTTFLQNVDSFTLSFTSASISPLPVTTGQRVVVSVDISFDGPGGSGSDQLIAGILARNFTVEGWRILVGLPAGGTCGGGQCEISENGGLVVTGPSSSQDSSELVFTGSTESEGDGEVSAVLVMLKFLPQIDSHNEVIFSANFDAFGSVVAGQSIDVDYTITFQ